MTPIDMDLQLELLIGYIEKIQRIDREARAATIFFQMLNDDSIKHDTDIIDESRKRMMKKFKEFSAILGQIKVFVENNPDTIVVLKLMTTDYDEIIGLL